MDDKINANKKIVDLSKPRRISKGLGDLIMGMQTLALEDPNVLMRDPAKVPEKSKENREAYISLRDEVNYRESIYKENK